VRAREDGAEPDEFLAHGVPAWLDSRTSHGICPDCLDRVTKPAAPGERWSVSLASACGRA
jgi:hypothetical protein